MFLYHHLLNYFNPYSCDSSTCTINDGYICYSGAPSGFGSLCFNECRSYDKIFNNGPDNCEIGDQYVFKIFNLITNI